MNRREIINKLIERDGKKCINCGKELTEDIISINHIIPRALGGSDEIDNLSLLCSRCNIMSAMPFTAYEAERYIVELLNSSEKFRNVLTDVGQDEYIIDIIAERKEGGNWQRIAIEVKWGTLTLSRIQAIINRINEIKLQRKGDNYKFILAVFSRLSEAALNLLKQNDIEVWDVNYLSQNFADEISRNPNDLFQPLLNKQFLSKRKSLEEEYIEKLKNCPAGRDNWSEYQKLVGEILSYLFCPPLLQPLSEKFDYSKTNRRDFIFPNYSDTGYWNFLRMNYHADYIVVDAKNYEKKISKKEVLQISNYLKIHGTGLFALIVSRNGHDTSAQFTLREEWAIDRKLIISLQDNDLEQMLLEKMSGGAPENVLRQRIEDFRLSF